VSEEFLSDDQKAEKSEGSRLRKELEAKIAELALVRKELDEIKATTQKQALASLWDGLDVTAPDKVKALYDGEPTKEALAKWVEENRDVYRFEPKTTDAEVTEGRSDEEAELAKLQEQLNATQGLGRDLTDTGLAGRVAQIRNTAQPKNLAELDDALDKLGLKP